MTITYLQIRQSQNHVVFQKNICENERKPALIHKQIHTGQDMLFIVHMH